MRVSRLFVSVFFLLFLVLTCVRETQNDVVNVIEVNDENWDYLPLSFMFQDIQYIPLKTSQNNFIERIDGIDFNGDFILIDANKDCFLYNIKSGSLIKIGQNGRGPEEYNVISNVMFGKDNNIYIQDSEDLIVYSIDGEYINKLNKIFRINDNYISDWAFINDTLIISKIASFHGNEDIKACIIDIKNRNIVKNYINFNKVERTRQRVNMLETDANIFCFNNEIFFKEFSNDTLFFVNETLEMMPVLVFDFGQYKYPETLRSDLFLEGFWDEFFKYIYVENIMMSCNYIFIDCIFGEHFPAKRITPKTGTLGTYSITYSPNQNTINGLGVYDLETEKLIFSRPTSTDNPLFTSGLFNDIDGGPRFYPKVMVNDSTLAMWVDAVDLKNHIESDDFKNAEVKYPEKKKKLEELANSLEDTDNPVMMLVWLR